MAEIDTSIVAAPAAAASLPDVANPAASAEPDLMAQAMALLAGTPVEVAPPVVEPPVVVPPAAVVPPLPEPDADMKSILARIARVEFERDQASERATQLAASADAAKSYAELQRLKDEDPIAALAKLGLTPEQIQDVVLNGAKKPDPTVTATVKAQNELAQRLAQIEAREAALALTARQTSFKAELPAKLPVTLFPLLHQVYGAGGVADQVFPIMQEMYKAGDRAPDPAKAAKSIEDHLVMLRSKLLVGASTPAAVPAGLTNIPTTVPRAASAATDSEDARFQAALDIMKGDKK